MNLYQYLGVAALCALSLFVGALIARYTKEELKGGFKYFRALKVALIYVISFLASFFFFENIFIAILVSFAVTFLSFLLPNRPRGYVFILIAALAFAVSAKNNTSYVVPALIFLFGICEGTITYYLEKNQLFYRLSTRAAIFFLFASALFFIPAI